MTENNAQQTAEITGLDMRSVRGYPRYFRLQVWKMCWNNDSVDIPGQNRAEKRRSWRESWKQFRR